MSYWGSWPEQRLLDYQRLEHMTGCTAIAKTDIVGCFPTMYTHSIPWAAHGVSTAKRKRDDPRLWGNVLDRATQATRDGQTNGLTVGPRSSNLIAEIVLTKIDQMLIKAGYTAVERSIDNYTFYARDRAQADRFLRDLAQFLRAFDLTMHEGQVLPLPQASEKDWVSQLNSTRLFTRKRSRRTKRFTTTLLDEAVRLARSTGNAAVLKYAIKMVDSDLPSAVRRSFVRQAMNLGILYPYLAPIMDEHVFQKHYYDGTDDARKEFINELFDVALERSHPSALCHSLHLALEHKVRLEGLRSAGVNETVREIDRMNDCLGLVLLYIYATRHRLSSTRIKVSRRAAGLRSADQADQDRFWLLLYQTSRARSLEACGQTFLAELKKRNFAFVLC